MKGKLETKTLKYITPSLAEQYRDILRKIGLEYKDDEKDDFSEDVRDLIDVDGKLLKVRYKQANLTSQYLDSLKSRKSLADILVERKLLSLNLYKDVKGGNE